MAQGSNLTMACFCMGPGGGMVLMFFKGCKKYEEVYAREASVAQKV